MSVGDLEFIKSLFLDIDGKVDKLQLRAERVDTQTESLLAEVRELKASIQSYQVSVSNDLTEAKSVLIKHEGHFNTLKIIATSGVAAIVGLYSWVVSFMNSIKPNQ